MLAYILFSVKNYLLIMETIGINMNRSYKRKNDIPNEFPLFKDWPEYKLDFMSKISSIIPENEEEYTCQSPKLEIKEEDKFVIATDIVYKYNETGRCLYCNDKLPLEYNIKMENWVYPDCELDEDKYVLHHVCMVYKYK